MRSVLPRYGAHLLATFDAHVLERGVFTALAGVLDLDEAGRVSHAMGHYAPTYDPACARKEAAPASFAQYLARARFEMAGSGNSYKLINAAASALLAASELAGGTYGRMARKSPHRRVIDLLTGTEAFPAYLALIERMLASRGEIADIDWQAAVRLHAKTVVRQLSGAEALGNAAGFLAWPEGGPGRHAGAAAIARTDNRYAYPEGAPQVRIRLGSIHSVKGETHTATLVLDSFYFAHHLTELKPWLLGAKAGGSRLNGRGNGVAESSRMLGRLRLHYVAMTRPTHLLCLAMRKDAFAPGELDVLTGRRLTVIDCCAPAQAITSG
jgi:DNA helicase-2/ATP-dependent DNA helicase PcrA